MIFLVMLCLNQFFGKILFIRHPFLSVSELITIRSVFASIIIIAIMNKKIKFYLFESVPRSHYSQLALRCCQGSFSFMCLYVCIRYFPVVFVTLVQNISPLLLAVFSWYLHGVKLTKIELIVLTLSFIGVVIIISGNLF
jgi:drug/metabolite transporter (DMT)-like permease